MVGVAAPQLALDEARVSKTFVGTAVFATAAFAAVAARLSPPPLEQLLAHPRPLAGPLAAAVAVAASLFLHFQDLAAVEQHPICFLGGV